VDSGEEKEIFDFSNLEERFGGVESFNISAETEQGADSVGFVTSRCRAIPAVVVSESGPKVEYAIC
jgi:hypothetical protein